MADAQLIVDVVLNLVDRTMKTFGASVNTQINKSTNALTKFQKTWQKMTKGFDMSFLSLLFGGMMLKRVFLDTTMSLISNYKEMIGQNALFSKSIEKLGGSVDYLKYSLIEGWANSDFTKKTIEKITNIFIKLGEFFDDHPKLATTLINVGIAIGSLGTAAMVMGGLKQIFSIGGTAWVFLDFLTKLVGLDISKLKNLPSSIKGISKISLPGGLKVPSIAGLTISAVGVVLMIKDIEKTINDIAIGDWEKVAEDIANLVGDSLITAAPWIFAKSPVAGVLTLTFGLILKFDLINTTIENIKKAIETTKQSWEGLDLLTNPNTTKEDIANWLALNDFNNKLQTTKSDGLIPFQRTIKSLYDVSIPNFYTQLSDKNNIINSHKSEIDSLRQSYIDLKNAMNDVSNKEFSYLNEGGQPMSVYQPDIKPY